MGVLAARLFRPSDLFHLDQFRSGHRQVAFSDPFVVPPYFASRRYLGECYALLSPLAESLRLAQWIRHERMHRRKRGSVE